MTSKARFSNFNDFLSSRFVALLIVLLLLVLLFLILIILSLSLAMTDFIINIKFVNESDPRSDVHYLGSSENKA